MELKPCPFCGDEPHYSAIPYSYSHDSYCMNCGIELSPGEWDHRPIEDALSAEISDLKAKLAAIFKETQLSCKVNHGTDYPVGWDDAMCCIQQILLGKMEGE
jgi:hypothetical protein